MSHDKSPDQIGEHDHHIQESILDGLSAGIGCSRRDLLDAGGKLVGVFAFAKLLAACKTVGGKSGLSKVPDSATNSFLGDVAAAEAATPLVVRSDPNFKAAAGARGIAVTKVVGAWLKDDPYGMIAELFSKTEAELPVFKPQFGPAIVFRHKHVIEALGNTTSLTVGRYSRQMKRATEGEFDPTKPGYFMLGTDNPGEYEGDSRILRHVLKRSDMPRLRSTIRAAIDNRLTKAKKATGGEVDMVQTICRFIPVDLVGKYLGVPAFEANEKFNLGKLPVGGTLTELKGGQEFDIPTELKATFQFVHITKAKVPTSFDLYCWIRDAFRNIFNNVSVRPDFERDGIKATENLVAYIFAIQSLYSEALKPGAPKSIAVPDTMLTRLIKLSIDVNSGTQKPEDLGFSDLADLKARLTPARIRENVFGTVVGAVANPEEANARIVSQVLMMRAGKIGMVSGQPDYSHFADLAQKNLDDEKNQRGATDLHMTEINRLALELLRLTPQGEVVMRACVAPITIGGVTLEPEANGLVFVSHGAAMRDPSVVSDPLKLSTTRDPGEQKYGPQTDPRPLDAPQSSIYLQHGFGRHKCLGRYASEMTMEEILRAVLLLKNPSIKNELRMDAVGLYAESLVVTYDPS